MMFDKKQWKHCITDVDKNFNYSNPAVAPEEKFQIENLGEIPTVVIFGWAGAIDKYLRAYAKLYEERGLRTIRYIVPWKYLFFQSGKMLKIGEEMADVWVKQKFKNSPIIVHALSNGGVYQYEVFARALKQTPHHSQIRGMIIDSSPTKKNFVGYYRAIEANVQSKYFKMPISVILALYASQKRAVEELFSQILKREYIVMNPYDNLLNEKCRWPQHFIYSTSDKVIPYKFVEEFANHRKSLGVDVTLKRYENSQHVQHYMKNKASYIRSVVKFVNKCLRK